MYLIGLVSPDLAARDLGIPDRSCIHRISSELIGTPIGNFCSPTLFRALLFTRLEGGIETNSIQASVLMCERHVACTRAGPDGMDIGVRGAVRRERKQLILLAFSTFPSLDS